MFEKETYFLVHDLYKARIPAGVKIRLCIPFISIIVVICVVVHYIHTKFLVIVINMIIFL